MAYQICNHSPPIKDHNENTTSREKDYIMVDDVVPEPQEKEKVDKDNDNEEEHTDELGSEEEEEHTSKLGSEEESDAYYDSEYAIESDGDVKSEYGDKDEEECIKTKHLYIGSMIDLVNNDYFQLDFEEDKCFYPTQSKEFGFIMYKDAIVSNEILAQRLKEIRGKYENVFHPRHYNYVGVWSWYYGLEREHVTKELKKYIKKINYKSTDRYEYPFCLRDLFITSSLDVLSEDYTVRKTRRINYLYVDGVCMAVICKRKKSEEIGIISGDQTAYILTSNNDIVYADIYKLDETLSYDDEDQFIGPVKRRKLK